MPAFVAGNVLTAAQLNAVQGTWTSFTPTLTGITKGNGTVTAEFLQTSTTTTRTTVNMYVQFTMGSTSAITGGISITLPATASQNGWRGYGSVFDTSANVWYDAVPLATNTTAVSVRFFPAVAGSNLVVASSTVPMTWATGDILTIMCDYGAA